MYIWTQIFCANNNQIYLKFNRLQSITLGTLRLKYFGKQWSIVVTMTEACFFAFPCYASIDVTYFQIGLEMIVESGCSKFSERKRIPLC